MPEHANPYLVQIEATLPRLLALFDRDPSSPSYGLGDRFRWAWGLIDFANGTFQGAAHGLARLVTSGLLPAGFDRAPMLRRIDALFTATARLHRRDGSLEEAFPHEASFHVTALVAYDLLSAVELLEDELDAAHRHRYLEIVRPLIQFLDRTEEHHAFASHHLATAAAALIKWDQLTGGTEKGPGEDLLNHVLEHQSEEGWFPEHGGADPGYQSLATCYLADIHRIRPELGLDAPLRRSLEFLAYCVQPDGSFGGAYGNRNTRFYFPGGIEYLAGFLPEAATIAHFMRTSIANGTVVGLLSMDAPNLVPMFNAYAWAAALASQASTGEAPPPPALEHAPLRKHFPGAGLIIDRGPRHYTVISTHKGGVVQHYVDGRARLIDTGIAGRNANRRQRRDAGERAEARERAGVWERLQPRILTTQLPDTTNPVELSESQATIEAKLRPAPRRLLKPWQFTLIRILTSTLLRWAPLRERYKRSRVRAPGSRLPRARGKVTRTIRLGEDLAIDDHVTIKGAFERIPDTAAIAAIHEPGQGFWQRQDDRCDA